MANGNATDDWHPLLCSYENAVQLQLVPALPDYTAFISGYLQNAHSA